MGCKFFADFVALNGELSRRNKNKAARSGSPFAFVSVQKALYHGDDECSSLSGTSHSVSNYVLAQETYRNGSSLDGSWSVETKSGQRFENRTR